jgi:hypothetical protein
MAIEVVGIGGRRSLVLLAGETRQRWVNRTPQRYSYLQKFDFDVCIVPSRPPQGAFRDRHETRAGMRWPRRRRRVRLVAGRRSREQPPARYDTALTAFLFGLDGERTPAVGDCGRERARTEKSCGPDARGLCVKSCGDVAANRCAHQSSARATGAIVHRSPRRARRTPLKPSAQGRPGDRHTCRPPRARSPAHAGLWVPPAPGLPCALSHEGEATSKTRAKQAARSRSRVRN